MADNPWVLLEQARAVISRTSPGSEAVRRLIASIDAATAAHDESILDAAQYQHVHDPEACSDCEALAMEERALGEEFADPTLRDALASLLRATEFSVYQSGVSVWPSVGETGTVSLGDMDRLLAAAEKARAALRSTPAAPQPDQTRTVNAHQKSGGTHVDSLVGSLTEGTVGVSPEVTITALEAAAPAPAPQSLRDAAQAVVDFDPSLHDEADAAWIFPRLLSALRAALDAPALTVERLAEALDSVPNQERSGLNSQEQAAAILRALGEGVDRD